MKNKERVVVAMSGGVDSSVAAALLQSKGYEVIGITMCFNLVNPETKKPRCCGLQGIEDARRVAHKLGIKHYVLNMKNILEEKVIKDFCLEYLHGRTPNPCIRCNQFIKFGTLLKKSLALDAKYLATGHYAGLVKTKNGLFLKKGKDKRKDQTYFLYRLGQSQLKHLIFPLANYTKDDVRRIAEELGLPVAKKQESQEICFLPQDNYRDFLTQRLGVKSKNMIKPGNIVDKKGKILGVHQGIAFYTIGQREGLGLALGYPVYITSIDAKANKITVGKKDEALSEEFLVKEPYFTGVSGKKKVAAEVKIRYNHQQIPSIITPFGKKLKIKLLTPQFAVTPGQSAVFYQKDKVIGGGIIERVLK